MGILVRYDLNYGYQNTRLKWLGAVLVQAYFAVIAVQRCPSPEIPAGMPGYVEFLFRGMPEYFVSETGKFELPVPWLLLHAYVLFLTASYPAEDFAHSGGQAIVRTGRCLDWLLGKAVWVAYTVTVYYLLLAGILALCTLAAGGLTPDGAMGSLTPQCVATGERMTEDVVLEDSVTSLRCWGQSLLMSLTLCLTELTLSLALESILSLFLMLGYLTASVFWASPALMGNFSMLLRQDFLSGIPGICFRNCLLAYGLWSAIALVLGKRLIEQKDLF